MEPVSTVSGTAYPWGQKNVDTDVIIPAHWLKTISRAGLGRGAFETVRREPGNVFDDPRFAGSPILIAGDNFGCGSSREHAAWALRDLGITAVIALSFSDIFSGNAFKNGIVTVVLPQEQVDRLLEVAKTDPITIDLETMTVTTPFQDRFAFQLDPFRRRCLLEGLDEVGLTLARDRAIGAYEAQVAAERPWIAQRRDHAGTVVASAGRPDTLELGELPDPTAGAGEVVVAVKACAINYPDVLVIEDKYQFKPQRPFAPGGEISGVIESVGEGVTGWQPGDRIMGNVSMSGLQERVVMKEASLHRLPEGRSFEEGASLLLTYGTTIHALLDRGHMKAGESLLVLGAAGGVGLAAVELGKAFGGRVVAAVSSEEKAAAAREAGADDVIIYGRAPFDKDASKALADQFKHAAGPNGFDLIYDPVGGDYAEPALRSIGWEGRYLVIGFPAGIPKIALNLTLLKSCDVCGVFWGAYAAREPKRNRANIERLFELWAENKIAPRVTETFAFEDGGKAIAKMANRGAIGKLVVRVGA